MTNKSLKITAVVLIFLFFLSAPFLQSFLFSTHSEGAIIVNKTIQADFVKSDKKIVLLFFGYVGCQKVCTPFLTKLSSIYESKEFQSVQNDIDVIFVNLTPDVEEFQADLFAKFFNKNFKGVYLSKKELFAIDRKFAMFFSQSINEKSELNHTDYLYLIDNANDKKALKNIYSTHPLRKQQLINDIISLKKQE